MPIALKYCRSACFLMFVVVQVGLCLVGSGCATTPQYQSKASSPADGAQVRGASKFNWTHWYKLKLEQVDGKKVNLSWWTDWTKPVLIDPGDRVMRVQCQFAMDSSPDSVTVDLAASLQAGHAYQLRCGIEDNAIAFWVEDTETHLSAGKQILTVNTTPVSPSQTAAGVTALLLFRLLLLVGTGG
jgi:hypothetical protein